MRTKEGILSGCPVATTSSPLGSRWELQITHDLLARPRRFNELRKHAEGVSQKSLTEALRSRKADGIVRRTAYPEVPPRVGCSLRELGESRRAIIKAMESWGKDCKAQMAQEQTVAREPGAAPSRRKNRQELS